ncbi:MAG: carboxypeptidase-like regulatory domain-containing protein [Bacteroidia bacterium]|nr:carboxypeptidase-like regulatory domain-containing protein [Bacteroidia bacterium]
MRRSLSKKGLFLTVVFAGLAAITNQAQDLNSALLLTKSEQYDKAGEMLQQLIQKEPSNSKYYFYLGENTLMDYYADTISNSLELAIKDAKEIYQKGVSANANDPLNYTGLAKVAMMTGDDKTATEMRTKARSYLPPYKKIKKIIPPAKEYAFALAKIAESYIKEKDVDTSAALPLIREAIKIDPKNPEIFLIAGDIYILANDGSNAIRNYNLAQFADPTSPTAAMKIGSIYVRGKSLNAAIPYFEEAIGLDANFAPAYRELGQLYWMAQRLDQSKSNYKKYLELSQGNIPAQTRYVTSLFYAGDYTEVIKNVEEILAVDKSRSFLNRLAGYSYYEMKNPDYGKAFSYMEELFKTVTEDRILWKDHHYMARILMKKNQNYSKMLDELSTQEQQLTREQSKYASASAAMKPKIKPTVDDLTTKVAKLKTDIANANKELDRGFSEYVKVLEMKPQDKGVISEMASNYYSNKRYEEAAKTWVKLINPANEKAEEYMQIGRAYYNGDRYKTADSVFNVVIKKWPDHIAAYVWIARTYSKMDPDSKLGLAKPKFEKVLNVAKVDSLKNDGEIVEACGYLGYYHMMADNYSQSKEYYDRMVSLDPNNKEAKIRGYNGIGSLELRMASNEKTNEGRLPYLSKSADAYNKILAIDPNNASAKNQVNYIHEFEASVRKGINPNEIKGVVKDAATGKVIAYASIRVKDTAAENLTNSKGEYKFEIPQGSEVLLISATGYTTKEIPITKSRVYNVSLEK